MKTVKELNIQEKPGYDKILQILMILILNYCQLMILQRRNTVPYIVFNNIECIFRKSGIYSYLMFCESDKNKKMLDKYIKVIDKIKKETLF